MIPAALIALTLSLGPVAYAQTAPATAPAAPAVTAACKDGSTQSGTSRRSVCRGHGGVEPLKGAGAATPAATTPAATDATPAEQTAPAAAPVAKTSKKASTPIVARTPTNPGDVWVNSKTKIYHCSGDPAYGKTKVGSFMTEAAAKTAGNRASHNKACAAS